MRSRALDVGPRTMLTLVWEMGRWRIDISSYIRICFEKRRMSELFMLGQGTRARIGSELRKPQIRAVLLLRCSTETGEERLYFHPSTPRAGVPGNPGLTENPHCVLRLRCTPIGQLLYGIFGLTVVLLRSARRWRFL